VLTGTTSIPPRTNIIPFGTRKRDLNYGNQKTQVVTPTGNNDGSVYVWPFRAVIGPRPAPSMPPAPSDEEFLIKHRNIRSAFFAGTLAEGKTKVTLDATSGNNRCDLIYAKVDLTSHPHLSSASSRPPTVRKGRSLYRHISQRSVRWGSSKASKGRARRIRRYPLTRG
jgi:hypothetical protein